MAYVVCGKWQLAPGASDDVLSLMTELGRMSRDEPGCVMWEAHRSLEDPDVVLFYEQYRDEQAFQDHWDAGHTRRLLPRALEFVVSRDRGRYTTVDL